MKTEVILANAGTGKTTALIERAIKGADDGLYPVLITYTNAAAEVMRQRLGERLKRMSFVGTIHGYGMELIRKYGEGILYRGTPRVAVIDEEQLKEMIRAQADAFGRKVSVTSVLDVMHDPVTDTPAGVVAMAVKDGLRRDMLLTYPMILELTMDLGQKKPNPDGTGLILVDEFQDASEEIDTVLEMLNPPTVFVVGDPRQSIFAFAGGKPEILTAWFEDPNSKSSELRRSYRCAPGICWAADLICPPTGMGFETFGTALAAEATNCISMPPIYENGLAEYKAVGCMVMSDLNDGNIHSIGVLARTNFLISEMGKILDGLGIPHRRKKKIDRQPDFSDLLSFLQLCANPESETLAKRVLRLLFGENKANIAESIALAEGISIAKVPALTELLWTDEGLPISQDALGAALMASRQLHLSSQTREHLATALRFLGASPEGWTAEPQSIGALTAVLTNPESMYSDEGKETETVVELSTIHAAKGKEWDVVYLIGANQGMSPGDTKISRDERNLWYVALTRARKAVTITCAKARRKNQFTEQMTDVKPHLLYVELKQMEGIAT